jgi:L-asparagine transporter-like permease
VTAALAFVFFTVLGATTFAQTQNVPNVPSGPGVTQEVMRQAAERAVQDLRSENGLTASDVANRALDMLESFATRATAALEQLTPEAWRILVRQQYVVGMLDIGIPLMFLVLVLTFWGICKRFNYEDDEYKVAFTKVIPVIALVIVGTVVACLLPIGIAHFVNPEYYAIRDILTMISQNVAR